jgi:hypothetical protein
MTAQRWGFPVSAGILFGLGLGGFFDGTVLHQVLQWHHMLTSAGCSPALGFPADSVPTSGAASQRRQCSLREPQWCVRVDRPMSTEMAKAWDTRVMHALTKLPRRLRSAVEWIRHPARKRVRLVAAALLVLGGILSILPIFGLWMLPLGLALMSDDIPWLKVPLEKAARGIERVWRRLRGRSP